MRERSEKFIRGARVCCWMILLGALPLGAQNGAVSSAASYVSETFGVNVDKVVESALVRNAELLAVRQRAAEASGLLLQSGLRPNPGFDVSVANGTILNSPGEREFTLGYAHTFELGGKRERRVEVGRLGTELARFAITDRERLLRADVKSRYGEALAAVRNLETAEGLLEVNRQSYRIAEARTQQGEGARLEQALLQVEVNRIESDRLLFANQVERAILELKTLAGMNLDEPLRLNGKLAPQSLTVSLPQIIEQALAARPDLQAARLEEKLGDAEIQLAKTEAVPNLIALGRYSRVSSRFDQLGLASIGGAFVPIRDTDNLVTAGVSITLPTRNRNQGNIQAAVARREAARLRRQFVEQVVRREVVAALSRYETALRALKVFDQGVIQQSQENLRVLRAAYQLGELRLLDVINEQRRLLDTQKAYTELLKESYLSLVDLERAVGSPLF